MAESVILIVRVIYKLLVKMVTYNCRHFSHVTKSRIFKNLNYRKKADRKKPFKAPKIIFKSPKLSDQKSLSYGHLLKYKRLKFTFLREPNFKIWYVGVHRLRRLKSTNTGISS